MRLLDRLRTVFPPVAGFLGSSLAVWAVKKGVPLTETQSTAAVTALGGLLWKAIAAHTNPNDAAAPSLVRNAPVPNVYVPVEVAPNDPSPYAPVAVGAETATPSTPFTPDTVCPLCTGEHGAHYAWCRSVGGDGVAPSGFFDDTRKIEHDYLRKQMGKLAEATPEVVPPAPEPEEKSRVLKPKPDAAPAPAKRTPKKASDVVKVRRTAKITTQAPGAPQPANGFEP